jgi:hypothetical protein
MFITKKKLNNLIEEERMKERDEFYQRERMCRLEEDMRKGLARLEQRVYKLEHPDEKENNAVNGLSPAIHY